LPVADLVSNFPGAAVPIPVDGEVLEEPLETALAAGRFAHVPVLNGTNHDEERVFISAGVAVTGTVVPVPQPVTAESYQQVIASVLGVPAVRASEIAAEYPLTAYASATVAVSALVGDANFACPALQLDVWSSQWAPTFAYEFNDDSAPLRFDRPVAGPRVATHKSEWPYLFDLPDAPFQEPFSPDSQVLAASMRASWASFAASGNPSTADVPWPAFDADSMQMLSLVPPRPQVERDFAARHHCAFWAA
ncbi:MAG TPA: carboxylesterase family protein, partial [Solirubrobacteraceae bacterium]|nr:carboxylesterase family protein [Solirubrobacteraceae bacterium]